MVRIRTLSRTSLLAVMTLACAAACGSSTISEPAPYPQYITYPAAPVAAEPVVQTAAPVSAPVMLSDDQLNQLMGPIALYPDPLLAEMLPASTYPQDIAAAAQWLQNNPNSTQDAIDAQSWDPTVKAMAHYPTVLQYMAGNMAWTQAVGAAFINQPQDVMDSVQALRVLAQSNANLQSNTDAQVVQDNGAIQIEPVSPEMIYVPVYDPVLVYTQPCPVVYGPAYPIGPWCDNAFNWGGFFIVVGDGWDHHDHHPGDGDHRPHNGDHGGHAPGTVPTGRWTHNPAKPAPEVNVSTVHQLGLDRPTAPHIPGGNRGTRQTSDNASNRPLPVPSRNRIGSLPIKPNSPSGVAAALHPATPTAASPRPLAPTATPVVPEQPAKTPVLRAPHLTDQTPTFSAPAPHVSVPAPRAQAPRVFAPAAPVVAAPQEAAPAPHLTLPRPQIAPLQINSPAPRGSDAEISPRLSAPHFDAPAPAPTPRVVFAPPPQVAPSAPATLSHGPSGFDNQGVPASFQATESVGGHGHR